MERNRKIEVNIENRALDYLAKLKDEDQESALQQILWEIALAYFGDSRTTIGFFEEMKIDMYLDNMNVEQFLINMKDKLERKKENV